MSAEETADDERLAKERGRYLARTTDLTSAEAEAVAWSQLGYTESGIAKRMGSTDSTISSRLDRAVAQYGPSAVWGTVEEEREGTLEEITAEEILGNPGTRSVWRAAAEKHPEHVPAALRDDVTDEETRDSGLDGGWDA